MDRFPRNFADNLRTSRGTLLVAAIVVAVLVISLMAAYSVFDLGSLVANRRP
jgi:hypothetical protein